MMEEEGEERGRRGRFKGGGGGKLGASWRMRVNCETEWVCMDDESAIAMR